MLNCEKNTPEMDAEVLTCFRAFDTLNIHTEATTVFEHGQWYITCPCGAQWSVNDASGPGTIDGFDFEQVSEGDEDYHREDE